MFFSTLLICLAGFINFSIAGYVLEDDYSPSNFFSMFSFFTDPDPTNGFVEYVDESTAQAGGLVKTESGSVYMGVDHTNMAPSGRQSVRITSNKSYNQGIVVVLDVAHMPEGCGTWPAFWMTGPDWPTNGEIDIIEGVNTQTTNSFTLHTGPGCEISSGGFLGTVGTSNCDVDAAGQPTNAGCSISSPDSNTYGAGLNAIGGGVFATEWSSDGISIYFFPRSSIPSDITSGNPDPRGWGTPQAKFGGPQFVPSIFKDQQIVFDTTLCGDWAGSVWSTGSCASKAATCNDFVASNPSAFTNAYWTVNSLKVYQDNGSGSSSAPNNSPAPAPVPTVESAPVPVPGQSSLVIDTIFGSGFFQPTQTIAVPNAPAVNGFEPTHKHKHAAPKPTAPATEHESLKIETVYQNSNFGLPPASATPREVIITEDTVQTVIERAPVPTAVHTTLVVRAAAKRDPVAAGAPQYTGGAHFNATKERRSHARHLLKHKRAMGARRLS